MYLIDTFPTNEINGLKYRVGRVFPFGATLIGDGIVNFSIFSKEAVCGDPLSGGIPDRQCLYHDGVRYHD